jgi:4-amino-4-deoxy-L-arabinose transferase-like glycosyltransferase
MDGKPTVPLWLFLLLALLVRLGAGVWWQERLPDDQPFFFPDSHSYWHLARTLALGEPYVYGDEQARVFRMPGYPLLLAPLFWIARGEPSPYAGRVVSALLGTASVAGVFCLARQLFSERTAWLAALWALFDPGSISQGVFVLSEAPFCPLLVLQLVLWYRLLNAASDRTSLAYALGTGCIAGVATLMRPSWLLFVPLVLLCQTVCGAWRQRRHWYSSGFMLVGLCLVLAPWWWRNFLVTGRFVPTTLQVGASLYDGLHAEATGGSDMSFVPLAIIAQQTDDARALTPPTNTFEERLDARICRAALAWGAREPRRVLELAAVKFVRIWTPWPNASDVGGFWPKLALALGYLPLMVVLLWGALSLLQREPRLWLLVAPALYFTLLHCIFVGSVRYRQPALLPLAVLAAGVLRPWWDTVVFPAAAREVAAT